MVVCSHRTGVRRPSVGAALFSSWSEAAPRTSPRAFVRAGVTRSGRRGRGTCTCRGVPLCVALSVAAAAAVEPSRPSCHGVRTVVRVASGPIDPVLAAPVDRLTSTVLTSLVYSLTATALLVRLFVNAAPAPVEPAGCGARASGRAVWRTARGRPAGSIPSRTHRHLGTLPSHGGARWPLARGSCRGLKR